MKEVTDLIQNQPLRSYHDCTGNGCPIPNESGVYAWFFSDIPATIPLTGTLEREGRRLLYVGISPKPDTKAGGKSRQTIRTRIRYHFRGNTEGSTLRKTLGCLLAEHLQIRLQVVGNSGKRMTFGTAGEQKLTSWLAENARVTWLTNARPWEIEDAAIKTLSLPLNLRDNEHHPFHPQLAKIRREAKLAARREE